MSRRIVLGGSRAQRAGRGGQTWVFLQYLLGFKRLGFDVLYLDTLERESCIDDEGRACEIDQSRNLSYFLDVMDQFGLQNNFALICEQGTRFIGLSREEVINQTKGSLFLLNIMGFIRDPEILAAAARRVFLDIDPGFGQMWCDLELADVFAGHDDFVTIGENIGRPNCTIPTCGLQWITTPQPVVLDEWKPCKYSQSGGKFTSVASWRGAYGPIEYKGDTYGLRVHEFRKFVELPRLTGKQFELALDIHEDEHPDLALLKDNGWTLVPPKDVAGGPSDYQQYIQNSMAEFQVAKNMYVQSNSGWFSDRTLCYLATGRPALVQDTGLQELYPTGEGLLTFTTIDEAIAGVASICDGYDRHAAAARRIAETYFDSDKVLARLLNKLGVA